MWELDYKESWVPKNWCFWTVVLVKTLESPLDFKEIQPVHPKWNQSLLFIGRIDAEAEAPILWPPAEKNWLTGKYSDVGKYWRQEEKGTTGDEMVGWHHWLDGHEFEQALGVGEGQGSLACCSPWGHKESDMTEWMKWTDSALKEVEHIFRILKCSLCTMNSLQSIEWKGGKRTTLRWRPRQTVPQSGIPCQHQWSIILMVCTFGMMWWDVHLSGHSPEIHNHNLIIRKNRRQTATEGQCTKSWHLTGSQNCQKHQKQ